MKPFRTDLLPTNRKEMEARGWKELDILLVTGDAYFDHPSHGAATIGRVLEQAGYRVGILARPNWKRTDAFKTMGRPVLFVGITAGAVDSTLNNYTADLAPRTTDAYAPANDKYGRPNFATVVYAGAAKTAFPKIPLVLGGVEASTRRFAYYDYLKKKIRRSVLLDTRADVLVFGPGEEQIVEVATRIRNGKALTGIAGTATLQRETNFENYGELPSFQQLTDAPATLLQQTLLLERELGPHKTKGFFQKYQEGFVVCEPAARISTKQLDSIHALPFTRKAHPSYKGTISALETVRWSIISQRGCPGGCSFCALAYHQGRLVTSRSEQSILDEVNQIAKDPAFKGTITDIGGPTANTYGIRIMDADQCRTCKRVSCLYPGICKNLDSNHSRFLTLLSKASRLPGIKHLFVASGIRHDLALKSPRFIEALATHYTGGHLKVAPEHSSGKVLKLMRKPSIDHLERFERLFKKSVARTGKKKYLIPYFISGFPGCTKADGDHAGAWLKRRNQTLEQVQNFIPLPGTMAAAMYASGKTADGESLYIPDAKERKRQKGLLIGKEPRKQVKRTKR